VKLEDFSIMRFRTALSLVSLFLLCFTVAVWSTPLEVQQHSVDTTPTAETQSLTGKIASVGDAEFALEVRQNQKPNTVQFLVDGNTKVEGKLSVGAQATVEFRSEDGKNIATHVSVMPTSGIQPY
jgi:hypothetical protein